MTESKCLYCIQLDTNYTIDIVIQQITNDNKEYFTLAVAVLDKLLHNYN